MSRRSWVFASYLLVLLLFLGLAEPAIGQETFHVTDLGYLDIDAQYVYGINDVGEIVGAGQTATAGTGWQEYFHADIYEAGSWVDLTPDAQTDVFANAINNFGQVLVSEQGYDDLLFTPLTANGTSGTFTDLGAVRLIAINNYGQIAGQTAAGQAFLWTPSSPNGTNGTWTYFGSGTPYGINNYGQVVGDFGLWTPAVPNGTTGSIASPAGNSINDYGQVISDQTLWTPGSANGTAGWTSTNLGFDGGYINKYGQIVGSSSTSDILLWTPPVRNGTTGTTQDVSAQLDQGGYYYAPANGISNYGQLLSMDNSAEPLMPVLLVPVVTASVITVGPNPIAGSLTAKGRVRLNIPPPYDAVVQLKSNNSAASVPATVTIPYGAYHLDFLVHTAAVASSVTGTLQASYGGVTKSASLTVRPIGIKSIALTPISVTGGKNVTGKVTLEAPAAPSNITVSLSSNKPSVAYPTISNITIAKGVQTAYFTITTNAVASITYATIQATANGITKSKTLTVNP